LNDVFIFPPALKRWAIVKINLCTRGEAVLFYLPREVAESLSIWPPGKYSRAALSFFTNFVGASFIKDSFCSDVAEVSDLVRVFPDRFDNRGKLVMRIRQAENPGRCLHWL
jgi:hypothetical protein